MTDALADFFRGIPPELAMILLAMIPITELRGSIPVGIGVYGMSAWSAVLFSLLGNILIVLVLIPFLSKLVTFLSRWPLFDRFFRWWFTRTERRFQKTGSRFGLTLGLMLFVAIPLPITGGWTGSAIATLFRMKFWQAFTAITFGMIIAALIVGFASEGIFSFFG